MIAFTHLCLLNALHALYLLQMWGEHGHTLQSYESLYSAAIFTLIGTAGNLCGGSHLHQSSRLGACNSEDDADLRLCQPLSRRDRVLYATAVVATLLRIS